MLAGDGTTDSLSAVNAGRHAPTVDSDGYVMFAKITTVYSLLYWSVVAFATMSILFLYRQIFKSRRFFTFSSNILIGLTFIWWVSGTICEGTGFQPMSAYWDTSVSGRYYLDYNGFWLSNMIAELLIETAILLLPIREIVGLQLETRKKILVVGMFCMGAFVLATGIVRIHYVYALPDMIPGVIWLSVHSSTAVISACLPTYSPLLSRIPGLRHLVARKAPVAPYGYSRNRSRSRPSDVGMSTRRTRPSAQLGFPGSPKLRQNSIDNILLEHPQYVRSLSGSGSGQERWHYYHTDSPISPGGSGTEKAIYFEEVEEKDKDSSKNGLTKVITIPSPVLGGTDWSPTTPLGIVDGGGETRRAGLERGLPHVPGEKADERL